MGTGTYKINGRRISMFSLPLSYTQREKIRNQAGIEWQMPVLVGYEVGAKTGGVGVASPDWAEMGHKY